MNEECETPHTGLHARSVDKFDELVDVVSQHSCAQLALTLIYEAKARISAIALSSCKFTWNSSRKLMFESRSSWRVLKRVPIKLLCEQPLTGN